MSMSNIEYSALKKKAGLHNWGFISLRDEVDEFDTELDEMDIAGLYSPDVLQQNNYGEYYALQDFEE